MIVADSEGNLFDERRKKNRKKQPVPGFISGIGCICLG